MLAELLEAPERASGFRPLRLPTRGFVLRIAPVAPRSRFLLRTRERDVARLVHERAPVARADGPSLDWRPELGVDHVRLIARGRYFDDARRFLLQRRADDGFGRARAIRIFYVLDRLWERAVVPTPRETEHIISENIALPATKAKPYLFAR